MTGDLAARTWGTDSGRLTQGRSVIRSVSVVIPVLNAGPLLREQLSALEGQDFRGTWEVVVADNGSTDGTRDIVEEARDKLPIRLVDASAVRGAGAARTLGARSATGDLIAFCDADDVVSPGWLTSLVEAAQHADLVGGRLEHDRLNGPHLRCWNGRLASEALPVPFGRLAFALSANLAVRRDVVETVGAWSPDYPHGGDDTDFCWRAQLAGFTLVYAPQAVVHYRHRDTVAALRRQIRNYTAAEVRLFAAYRHELGLPRRSGRAIARSYVYCLTRWPYALAGRRRRGMWLGVVVETAARARESARLRVMYL